jgi:hypothetical protein
MKKDKLLHKCLWTMQKIIKLEDIQIKMPC